MRVRVFGYVTGFIAIFSVALLLCAAVLAPSAIGYEARPEFRSGNVVAGEDLIESGMAQLLLHRETVAATDEEAYGLSFAPVPGSGTVLPTIAQTSDATTTATNLGLFASNFQFCPVINYGALPVGIGQFGKGSPVTTAVFSSNALLYPEMVVEGNLLGKGDLKTMINTGITLPPAEMGTAYNEVKGLLALESSQKALGFSAKDAGLPVVLSSHTVNFAAPPAQINNTSIVERLWRNAKQGTILDYMYEGDASYPVWIAPLKNPLKLIECGNMQDAIKNSLQMTHTGGILTRSLWTL